MTANLTHILHAILLSKETYVANPQGARDVLNNAEVGGKEPIQNCLEFAIKLAIAASNKYLQELRAANPPRGPSKGGIVWLGPPGRNDMAWLENQRVQDLGPDQGETMMRENILKYMEKRYVTLFLPEMG